MGEYMPKERLVIIVDAEGFSMAGKTAALTSIVREMGELLGPGAGISYAGRDNEIAWRIVNNKEPEFNRNDVRITAEVFHSAVVA